MNRTEIPWVRNPDGSQGYTLNPLSGCENHTPEGLCLDGLFPCYAYKLANGRLKSRYLANINIAPRELSIHPSKVAESSNSQALIKTLDPFYPRFWEERMEEMTKRNNRLYYDGLATAWKGHIHPRGIFVASMGDLFGTGVPEQWTERVLDEIWGNKGYDRFYVLTKQANRLPEFSPFPENCWVGVTACNWDMAFDAFWELQDVKASVKYISFEPLLGSVGHQELEGWLRRASIKWLIIGACTGSWVDMAKLCLRYGQLTLMPWGKRWTAQPPIEWLSEIVEAADKAGIRVFLKDNLMPLFKRGDIWAIPEWAGFNDWSKQDIGTTLRQEMPE